MSNDFAYVGKRLPRSDGVEKATGAAKFTADIDLPGMMIGKVLRSPYAHAKIVNVDTCVAKKLPGVKAVITFADVPKKPFNPSVFAMMRPGGLKTEIRDQYVLSDKARFVGDAIAAVAAISRGVAEEAIGLIKVEYQQLPAVLDLFEALKPGAAKVHDFAEGNLASHVPYAFPIGNVEKGLREADYVIEDTYSVSKQKHCQLEPTACVASYEPSGRLTVWSPHQLQHSARTRIAEIFDIPEGNIRWFTPAVGGAFGGRLSLTNEPICIALTMATCRPVKLDDTREEDFIAHESRHPFIEKAKIGFKKDGTLTALHTEWLGDVGAYFTQSSTVASVGMRDFLGLYRCPNLDGETKLVYTNTPMSGGMRGYGNPEAMFALEQIIDAAAKTIGMDPINFRLKNLKNVGEPSSSPTVLIDICSLDECLKIGAEKIGWKEKHGKQREGRKRRGVGVACCTHASGGAPGLLEHSSVFMNFNAGGSVNVIVSPCEMGQGILGVLAQIVAEELGLKIEDVHMVTGDTDATMYDIGSHASRTTYVLGNAVISAAKEVKAQILERAAKTLGAPPEELTVKHGSVYLTKKPEKGVSVAEVCKNAIYNFEGQCHDISGKCSYIPGQSRPFQAVFAEVEVDTETGEIKVLKIIITQDSGRAINPMNVEGQLEGGAAQGVGYALFEDFVVDMKSGVTISDSFATYKIPTALDLPEIEVVLVEKDIPSGPFGARGVGEMGSVCTAPAIANAIYDAVGVRYKDLPITPEKILKALRAK